MQGCLQGKKVLLTGATGFIGASLTRKLLHEGCQVSIFIRRSSDFWRIKDIFDQVEVHYVDLRDLSVDDFKDKIKGTHIIYHLGAAGVNQFQKDSLSIVETNIRGTLCLLQLARDLKVERFVYCGSCFEYGSGSFLREDMLPAPGNEYAASKLSAGILVNTFFCKYGLPTVYLRPFTVYGPFEGPRRLIPHVIRSILEGRDIELTEGEQTRDMVFIDDVLEAFLIAGIEPKITGKTFNLATGQEIAVKDVVLTLMELMATRVKPLFGKQSYRESEWWALSGNPSYTRDILKWQAQTSLKDGLQKTIQWFEKNWTKYPVYITK